MPTRYGAARWASWGLHLPRLECKGGTCVQVVWGEPAAGLGLRVGCAAAGHSHLRYRTAKLGSHPGWGRFSWLKDPKHVFQQQGRTGHLEQVGSDEWYATPIFATRGAK